MPGDDDEIIIRRHFNATQTETDVDTTNGTFKNMLALLPSVITDSGVAALVASLKSLTT